MKKHCITIKSESRIKDTVLSGFDLSFGFRILVGKKSIEVLKVHCYMGGDKKPHIIVSPLHPMPSKVVIEGHFWDKESSDYLNLYWFTKKVAASGNEEAKKLIQGVKESNNANTLK